MIRAVFPADVPRRERYDPLRLTRRWTNTVLPVCRNRGKSHGYRVNLSYGPAGDKIILGEQNGDNNRLRRGGGIGEAPLLAVIDFGLSGREAGVD